MQSISAVAPAIIVLMSFQANITLGGVNSPLVTLAALILLLMLGSTLVNLSRLFPSAGGYFTYVSRTLHPRVGFIVAWVFVLYSAITPSVIFVYFARIVQLTLAPYGIHFSWFIPFAAVASLVGFVIYRGIQFSGKFLLVTGMIEIAIVVVFSALGFFAPRDGSISLTPFDPRHISAAGFSLAVIFAMFNCTGWESAAPVAEESENPRRNIPIATMFSILFTCALLTLCTWGLMLSWGVHDLPRLVGSVESPTMTLAHSVWGSFWWILLLALANSVIGGGIAFSLVSTRMWYAMGRAGVLPATFAVVHPTHRTPSTATWLQIAIFFGAGIGGAAWFGVDSIYLVGALITIFALVIIYIAANIGLTYYMWTQRRSDFRWASHGIFPTISTIALLILFYKSLVPAPSYPVRWAPLIVGAWTALGLLLVLVSYLTGREAWLLRASAASETTADID